MPIRASASSDVFMPREHEARSSLIEQKARSTLSKAAEMSLISAPWTYASIQGRRRRKYEPGHHGGKAVNDIQRMLLLPSRA